MKLTDIFTEKTLRIGLEATNKEDILIELVDFLFTSGQIQNKQAALSAVLDREKKMSTGMKQGIAIPHGKTDTIRSLVACMVVSKKQIDFSALDGKPTRIFIVTLSPPDKIGLHLQFLAGITELFNNEATRTLALNSNSPVELLNVIRQSPHA